MSIPVEVFSFSVRHRRYNYENFEHGVGEVLRQWASTEAGLFALGHALYGTHVDRIDLPQDPSILQQTSRITVTVDMLPEDQTFWILKFR